MSEESKSRHRYVIVLPNVSPETFADVYSALSVASPPLAVTRRHDEDGKPADIMVDSPDDAGDTIAAVLQQFPVEYSIDEVAT